MDTPDTVEKVATKKKLGRPKKQDPTTPMGEYIAEQAKKNRESKKANKVVEKYYEIKNSKLVLCKKIASGTVFRTFIGSTEDKKDGKSVQDFVKKLQAEGRIRVRI